MAPLEHDRTIATPRRSDARPHGWRLDDERLRALVEHPPVCHARLLGTLLSIRLADDVSRAIATTTALCIEAPPPDFGPEVIEELVPLLDLDVARYELRASLAIVELSGLLDLPDVDPSVDPELERWRWLLHDLTRALDPALHRRLEALWARCAVVPEDATAAWYDLLYRRHLDACVGLLLARAAMLDPRPRPRMLGATDELSTDSVGSFAWWCRWSLDVAEDDYPLGERLRVREIEMFVGQARRELQVLDAGLLQALLERFPGLRG